MRFHTDKLRASDFRDTVERIGGDVIGIGHLREHGSRTHETAVELNLTGHSLAGGAYGTLDYTTATWDEWGIILHALYELDPDMRVGGAKDPIYEDQDDFVWQTCGRFAHLRVEDACKRHKWDHEYERGIGWAGSTCKRCGAEKRPSQRRIDAILAGTWGRGY